MAAIYSNGGNRWNILGFNFTKRDALSSVYKISMELTKAGSHNSRIVTGDISSSRLRSAITKVPWLPNHMQSHPRLISPDDLV